MKEDLRIKYSFMLACISALLFIPFIGGVHLFDWDEINFAEISREMILIGDYTRIHIDYFPFWEKPPLFFWLQALSMKIFGVGEFAARFPNAVCGIVTIVLLYNIGHRIYDHRFGLVWALAYVGSVLPFLYFKSGIIDPVFNLFIFLGLYHIILFNWSKNEIEGVQLKWNKWIYLILAGFFTGCGILTKGPAAIVILLLCLFIYWIYKRFKLYISVKEFLIFILCLVLVTFTWFGWETYKNGPWFISEFISYQIRLFTTPDAGHKGFPGFHFIVLLIGCFPSSIFAIRSFFKLPDNESHVQRDFRRWMKYLFWVVLILFSIVESKIVHYSSLSYFPLTFLASVVMYKIIEGDMKLNRWITNSLFIIGGIYTIIIFLAPILAWKKELIIQLLHKDPFIIANLQANVNWTGWEALPGILLLVLLVMFFVLFKKGRKSLSVKVLFGGVSIFMFISIIFFIKRIEGYSQRAAIDFIKEKSIEDCYVIEAGYKSYAPLFYLGREPGYTPEFESRGKKNDWLLYGPVDKDVYIITRIDKLESVKKWTSAKEIGRKNGFVFLKRTK